MCDEEMARIDEAIRKDDQKKEMDIGRDAGNMKAKEARLRKHDEDLQKAKQFEREVNESYVEQMMPVWARRLEDVINERNAIKTT